MIFEKNANFEKKSAFFTIAIEKVTARCQNDDAQEVAKSMLPIRILFFFYTFFQKKCRPGPSSPMSLSNPYIPQVKDSAGLVP